MQHALFTQYACTSYCSAALADPTALVLILLLYSIAVLSIRRSQNPGTGLNIERLSFCLETYVIETARNARGWSIIDESEPSHGREFLSTAL
jgi:hypothetical protein